MIILTVDSTRKLTADNHFLGNQNDVGFEKFTVIIPKVYKTVDMTTFKAQLEFTSMSGKADSIDLGAATVDGTTLKYYADAPDSMYYEKGYVHVQISTYKADNTKFWSSNVDKQFKVDPSLDTAKKIEVQQPKAIRELQAALSAETDERTTNDETLQTNITNIGDSISNVDNTSDLNKPVSTAQQAALDAKVNKDGAKGLSENNYSTAEKSKLAGIEAGAQVNPDLSGYAAKPSVKMVMGNYTISPTDSTVIVNSSSSGSSITLPSAIDLSGKLVLLTKTSSNYPVGVYPHTGQTIGGRFSQSIRYGGDILAVQSDGANWLIVSDIIKQDLADIAFSGSYEDLADTPDIPTQYTDAMADGRADARITAQKGAMNGIASLGGDGKINEVAKEAVLASNFKIDANNYSNIAAVLNSKVDKITGKGLIADAEIARLSTVTQYSDAMADARITAQKNAANGVAGLDANTKLAAAQLPNNVVAVSSPIDMPYLANNPVSDANITITSAAHGFSNGQMVEVSDGTGAMPSGLSALKISNAKFPLVDGRAFVYVINKTTDTFQVCTIYNGSTAIALGSVGTAGWKIRKAGDTSILLTGLDFNADGGTWELEIVGKLGLVAPNNSVDVIFNNISAAGTYYSSAATTTWGYSSFYISSSPISFKKYADFVQNCRIQRVNSTTVSLRATSLGVNTDDFATLVVASLMAGGKAVHDSFSNLTSLKINANGNLLLNGTMVILRRVSNNANGL